MKQTRGKCCLCNNEFSKQGMLKHIYACDKRKEKLNNQEVKQQRYKLLKIEAKYNKKYWLFIYIKDTCKLWDLDLFLRAIWLECCGHLSHFCINGEYYENEIESAFDVGERPHDMDVKIKRVLKVGIKADYAYDFGSTTELTIQVCEDDVKIQRDDDVILLARNNKPEIICDECHVNPASYICMDYVYGEEDAYICDKCLDKRQNEEEAVVRYVNSPRTGVCAYDDDVETIEELEENMNDIRNQMHGFYTTWKDMGIERENQLGDDDYFSMDNLFDDDNENTLFQEFFDDFDKYVNNADKKYYTKLMKSLKKPVELKDALSKHIKDELKMCADFFEIEIDSKIKKAELVDLLAKQLPEALLNSFEYMDQKILDIYKSTIKNNGKIVATNLFGEEALYQVIWIFGLIHQIYLRMEQSMNGEELIGCMPQEISTKIESIDFNQYKQSAKRNDRIAEIVEALVEAYGIVKLDTIQEVLSKEEIELDNNEVNRILNYAMLDGYEVVKLHDSLYKNDDLMKDFDMLTTHEEQKIIPYKQYTGSGLSKSFMIQSTRNIKEVKAFEKYMRQTYGIDKAELEDLMDEILDILRDETNIESYCDDMAGMIDVNNKAERNTFRNRFLRMAINVPTWYLKGHSIAEADRLFGTHYNTYLTQEVGQVYSMVTKRKIGRNEACPCGSGKKYKQCCGK